MSPSRQRQRDQRSQSSEAIEMANAASFQQRQRVTPTVPSSSFFARLWRCYKPTQTLELTSANQRDLYALERTFLAYNRTANHLASHGVVVAQVLALKDGYRHLGTICGFFMICAGIVVSVAGCYRYLSQARALQPTLDPSSGRVDGREGLTGGSGRGKAKTGGMAVVLSAAFSAIITIGLLVVVLVTR